jgi:hypothetical protein
MRGLDEIQKTNAFPHANDEEQFGTRHVGGSDFDRRNPASLAALAALGSGLYATVHGAPTDDEIVDDFIAKLSGRPKDARPGDKILEAILSGEKIATTRQNDEDILLVTLALLDIFAHDVQKSKLDAQRFDVEMPEADEGDGGTLLNEGSGGVKDAPTFELQRQHGDETGGVHSEGKLLPPLKYETSPFHAFWAKRGTLDYDTAKRIFSGGATPIGAISFIGKEWDGIRAVPAKPVTYLGGERPAYHGQYRAEQKDGSQLWLSVTNSNDSPISYQIPEAALTAARARKNGEA